MKALLEEETEKISIEEEIGNQHAKVATAAPMIPELFMKWKKKKMEEREAALIAMQTERAKNGCISGGELFLLDASLFVDDADAYEKCQREESDVTVEMDKSEDRTGGPSSLTPVKRMWKKCLWTTTTMNWTWMCYMNFSQAWPRPLFKSMSQALTRHLERTFGYLLVSNFVTFPA